MRKTPTALKSADVVVNAVTFMQGETRLYCFALPGNKIAEIADISRVSRSADNKLEGFQRPEIQSHVKEITEYLDNGPGLFPNAVILALAPNMGFDKKRGTKRGAITEATVDAGTLTLPARPKGERVAWIVDGQQRTLALAKSKKGNVHVPVIAFESASIETQREQFILVNRARQLSRRLVNELLPATAGAFFPRDLTAARAPNAICDYLHDDPASPFKGRINRLSRKLDRQDTIIDSAVVEMIRERINGVNGALLHLRGDAERSADAAEMTRLLVAYWNAVAAVFPDAWKRPPTESKLTASVGIKVMGTMMDRISARIGFSHKNQQKAYETELQKVAKSCAWTSGQWGECAMPWDMLEKTPKSYGRVVQALSSQYVRVSAK